MDTDISRHALESVPLKSATSCPSNITVVANISRHALASGSATNDPTVTNKPWASAQRLTTSLLETRRFLALTRQACTRHAEHALQFFFQIGDASDQLAFGIVGVHPGQKLEFIRVNFVPVEIAQIND